MSAPQGPRTRTETTAGVLTITLDSPHNRNALSDQLVSEVLEGLAAAAGDEDVRCVVLTHTGNTFCAGADLSEARGNTAGDPAKERADQLVDLLRAIVALPKPVIGRIDGHVRAGGMGLVGACDIVIASEASTYALTESRLGLAASVISLTVLPRLDPRAASRWFLTGSRFDVIEAARTGLVTQAVAGSDELDEAVARVTRDFGSCSPQGLRETKALVTHEVLAHIDAHRERVATQSARLFVSEEAREGMLSFMDKRAPRWAS
ncbi:enoyl-CoA hydratase [Janibacter sp. Soil728]|uniref:enoyl-CoA hydratase family protein n=1 Tax=Janibacter sp. Soil728 TaxID=1736393 RepID=UPI0006F1C619|nr:enoyl-CoA hydratase family protein [Janibacter sp. Soil728]KRE38324.1 enoyl-CoA hydratase [Janibacter sp. Soil728]